MATTTKLRSTQPRNDLSVKVDADIVRKAKLIAAHRELSMAAYLSEVLDEPVAQDFARMCEKLRQLERS